MNSPEPVISPSAFLVQEIRTWLSVHAPQQVESPSVWRTAIASIDADWAQLAEWCVELSTQLSVSFMTATKQFKEGTVDAQIQALSQDIAHFLENESQPGWRDRFKNPQARRDSALEESTRLQERYGKVKAQHDQRQAHLHGVVELASLLEQASEWVLSRAPAIELELHKLQAASQVPLAAGDVFADRAARRRGETAELGLSALAQVVGQIQADLPHKEAISTQLKALRSQGDQVLGEARQALANGVANLTLERPALPVPASTPNFSMRKLFRLDRHEKVSAVSEEAGEALLRIQAAITAPTGIDTEALGRDIKIALLEKNIHKAWIGDTNKAYALATILDSLAQAPKLYEDEDLNILLVKAIENYATFRGWPWLMQKDEIQGPVAAMQGKGVAQAIVAFAHIHSDTAWQLLHKTAGSLDREIITNPEGNQENALQWISRWVAQQPTGFFVEKFWVQGMARISLERVQSSKVLVPTPWKAPLGAIEKFALEKAVKDLGKASSLEDTALLTGLMLACMPSSVPSKEAPLPFRVFQWEFTQAAYKQPEAFAKLFETLALGYLQRTSGPECMKLAEWLIDNNRLEFRSDVYSKSPVLHAFMKAADVQKYGKNTSVKFEDMEIIFQSAPKLLPQVIQSQKIRSDTSSYLSEVEVAQLLPSCTSWEQAEALVGSLFYTLKPMGDKKQIAQDILEVALEKGDGFLAASVSSHMSFEKARSFHPRLRELAVKTQLPESAWMEWVQNAGLMHGTGFMEDLALPHHEPVELLGCVVRRHARRDKLTTGQTLGFFDDLALQNASTLMVKLTSSSPLPQSEAFIQLLSGALDEAIEEWGAGADPKALDERETRFFNKYADLLEILLKPTSHPEWGITSSNIAQTWKKAYTQRWLDKKAQLHGQETEKPPALCELVTHLPEKADTPTPLWAYSLLSQPFFGPTDPVSGRQAPGSNLGQWLIDKKMAFLIDRNASTFPGLHLRFSCHEDGERRVMGVDRSVEMEPGFSIPEVLKKWKEIVEQKQQSLGKSPLSPFAGLQVEVLPYQKAWACNARLMQEANRVLPMPGDDTAPQSYFSRLDTRSWTAYGKAPVQTPCIEVLSSAAALDLSVDQREHGSDPLIRCKDLPPAFGRNHYTDRKVDYSKRLSLPLLTREKLNTPSRTTTLIPPPR